MLYSEVRHYLPYGKKFWREENLADLANLVKIRQIKFPPIFMLFRRPLNYIPAKFKDIRHPPNFIPAKFIFIYIYTFLFFHPPKHIFYYSYNRHQQPRICKFKSKSGEVINLTSHMHRDAGDLVRRWINLRPPSDRSLSIYHIQFCAYPPN